MYHSSKKIVYICFTNSLYDSHPVIMSYFRANYHTNFTVQDVLQ